MKIGSLTGFLETFAPPAFQEEYDNSGLITGDKEQEVNAALISLDCTEDVVDEAIRKGCGMIVSHHPILFRGLKKLSGGTYVERALVRAIRNDIAIYAIHTNLDNIREGVNARLAQKLGLTHTEILSPKANLLRKLVTFCPVAQAEKVRMALFDAGAGEIGNYANCSFNSEGWGTFKGNDQAHPFAGEPGVLHREPEQRIETVFMASAERRMLKALLAAHPYEEVAYDIFPLIAPHSGVGSGMIGRIAEVEEGEFLQFVKEKLSAKVIRHTRLSGKKISKVAICGGSGSFLLPAAMAAGADIFITADYKYHEFFDADGKIVIADVGHFESEQFTQELLYEVIQKKFPTFALHLTEINTNPINYLI